MALITQNSLLTDFSAFLKATGYGKSTVKMLSGCLLSFLAFVNFPKNPLENSLQHSLEGIFTEKDITLFYEHCKERKNKRKNGILSASYVYHHIYSLKVFFCWLQETTQISVNPMSGLHFEASVHNMRSPLSQKQIALLFENALDSKETALLHLFYSCGLRRSEGEKLNKKDIHFSKNLLYVRCGKGAKRRVIPLTDRVKVALEASLEMNKDIDNEAFMCNKRGTRMNGNQYNNLFKKILKRLVVGGEDDTLASVSLHHLRHSIATHLLENGLSVLFVRDFLGHKHLEATQIYAKVSNEQLNKIITL